MNARCLLAALALCAVAGAQGGGPDGLFERLDADRSGTLGAAELRSEAALGASWIAVDRDRDGEISRGEFRPIAQPGSPSAYSTKALLAKDVREILVDAAGRVLALETAGGRISWHEARPAGGELRLSELIGAGARLAPGRYAAVEDVIVTPEGEATLIVVNENESLLAYPWPESNASIARNLRPFAYAALGMSPP